MILFGQGDIGAMCLNSSKQALFSATLFLDIDPVGGSVVEFMSSIRLQ